MHTSVIAVILVVLLILGGFLFFGRSASAPSMHVMPDGTVMDDRDLQMEMHTGVTVPGTHVMPDGTMMDNTTIPPGTHMMPDGSMMHN